MGKTNNTGLTRIIKAAGYSFCGFKTAWSHEAAFRQEVVLVAILFPLGLWLGNNGMERALLTGSCMVVLITELLNSAVEAVVDRIGPEQHSLSGAAKDLGSAAVFVSLVMVAMVWGFVLWDAIVLLYCG